MPDDGYDEVGVDSFSPLSSFGETRWMRDGKGEEEDAIGIAAFNSSGR